MTETLYDQVPYPGSAYPQAHPDRLATIATLFGMSPPDVGTCRVLELGCGTGEHLVPMAAGLPKAQFLGIDLSPRQIEAATLASQRLGLTNLDLQVADIRSLGNHIGIFDYIIAYGVYSWVDQEVQEKLLQIMSNHLQPHGVGLVAYNTRPGWHMFEMVRDMMIFDTRDVQDPLAKVTRARQYLDYISRSSQVADDVYAAWLMEVEYYLSTAPDAYVLHDLLEEINEPLFFFQFMERAQKHKLQFLGEANYASMVVDNFPDHVLKVLRQEEDDRLHIEQCMDFLRNKKFRSTLLCHQQRTLTIPPKKALIRSFSFSCSFDPGEKEGEFRSRDGHIIIVRDAEQRELMEWLFETKPQWYTFDELAQKLNQEDLLELLQLCLNTSSLYFHLRQPTWHPAVSELPRATGVALLQAELGNQVTNLRHEALEISDDERTLLLKLDGNSKLAELTEELDLDVNRLVKRICHLALLEG
ncbi:MAG: methyltransferase domain-containing protein [Proteobacteria bacterium]|jgi:SAM-dependent methyltransferase|nr:methyltransferase domain-containing protein [Pseudomonadota bacterium]